MGFFKRLRADEQADRDAGMRAWVSGLDGVTLVKDAEVRSLVTVAGVVSRLRVQPRDLSASFEVTVSDGTGRVRAVWLGRRDIPGLRLGSRVILEGRLGCDTKGHLQLVNPVYQLKASS